TPPVLTPKDPTPTVITNPPPPKPTTTTPPKVEPTPTQPKDPTPRPAASTTRHWNITRNGTSCTAMDNDACAMPASKPGEAVASCNPPRPTAYACPANLADHASMTIVQYLVLGEQRADAVPCFIDRPAPKCAPNAKCNPPSMTKIACP
ncbi:MAG: hypothetical protein NT062_07845, partial [Proteobacteria bacterium]|nr:hypothetical protein [Pseudomonadota bacterium]